MTGKFIRAILPYMRQVWGLLVVGSLGGLVMNTAVVLPAVLLGRTIDTALAWGEGRGTSQDVLWVGLAYAGSMALYQAARLVKRWGLRMANQRIQATIRADALRGVLTWPVEKLSQYPIGDLMARIIGDVEVLIRGVSELDTETWDTVLFSISLTAGMLVYDPVLTLWALLPVPLGMLLARSVERWVRARTLTARQTSAALTAFLQENLSGLRVVRLFGRRAAADARAAELSERLAQANLAIIRLRSGLQPVYTLLMTAGIVFVIWLGGGKVAAGTMTLGVFVAYLDLYRRFVGRGHRIPQLFNSVQSAAAAYERVAPLLAPPTVPPEGRLSSFHLYHIPGTSLPAPSRPKKPAGALPVILKDIQFRYPGNKTATLDGVSLDIPAGALVAVTGPVGSGKSALAKALLGLYPLAGGGILLDGMPLESLSSSERAVRIGYLPQNPFLFSGTIRHNILIDFDQIGTEGPAVLEDLLELTMLRDDLDLFPQGLETEIGERGVRVSGGQRQRIALARALSAAPGLFVLDDPFSSVDVDTEAQIITSLRAAFGPDAPPIQQATIIFFSHRLAAFPLADQVVVLDQGRIVEQGAHQDLCRQSGLYARIFQAQQLIGGNRAGGRPQP